MKCEPFRLKPTMPKQRRCNPVIRVRENDFWLLSDLRDRTGMSLCEIVHQCLTYCMQHTDLTIETSTPVCWVNLSGRVIVERRPNNGFS